MPFELERINRIIKDLEKYMYPDKIDITTYKVKEGNAKGKEAVTLDDADWDNYTTGELWGGYDRHMWFRTTFKVPHHFKDKFIVFRINTGHKEGWDISNPQFLCYLNGEIVQGLDVNHRTIIIHKEGIPGEELSIALLGYSGLNKEKVCLKTELVVVDKEIEDFYYNLKNLFWAACILEADDTNRVELLKSLDKAVDKLDLRKIYSKDFYLGLREANEYLKQKFYTQVNDKGPVVTTIGHTHIDVAWLWSVDQTREKVVRSFSTVLYLMEEYPEYKFMSSQPQLYQFLKEECPAIYTKVKEKVKEGRWEVDGVMWLEADCNIPSGESLVRQILKGSQFFKEEFGVTCKTLWLPDVFGYSAVLPQLLQKSGIKYFLTTKLDWNQFNKMPHDSFIWRGIDGSEVFTHLVTTTGHVTFDNEVLARKNKYQQTTYNGRLNPNQVLGTWTRYKDKNINDETLQLFGFGDGGGGPTEEMLQNAKRLKYGLPGLPRVNMDFQGSFFDRVYHKVKDHPDLAKWVGELYFECHRGTYTSMAKNKRYNRKAEFLYQDIEMLGALGTLFGAQYPKASIDKGWQTILLNQFHDIIPGTSIKKVYDQTDKEYEELFKEGKDLLEEKISDIAMQIQLDNTSIVVFNTLSHVRNDKVEVVLPEGIKIEGLKDECGQEILVQHIEDNKIIFFAKGVPPKGYKVYEIVKNVLKLGCCEEYLKDDAMTQIVENDFYQITFDECYQIRSIFDKVNQREIVEDGKKANVFKIFEDRPMDFENWDIDSYYKKKMYVIDELKEVRIIENGPVRKAIAITRPYYDSTIRQIIYLYKDIPRIDFKTEVDWHEKQVLLKVAFPVDVNTDKATYEIQYGNVERSTHSNTSWDEAKFEMCAHKWVDLSEAGYGVSLLNDCKYGHSIKDNQLELTLIKCGEYPNPQADIGYHEFTYSLYAHKKTWREAKTQEQAYHLNVPMHSRVQEVQQGTLPKSLSMLSVDKENCIMEVIKAAENEEGIILRLFECQNKRTQALITSFRSIEEVYECDLLENKLNKLENEACSFNIQVKPYEIKTYFIKFKGDNYED